MTKSAVVHIGIIKTGTKTIQKALFAARERLLSEARILYPSIAANQSTYLGAVFRDEAPRRLRFIGKEGANERSVARRRREIRASLDADLAGENWETVVISGESLSGFDPKAIARLIEWLTPYVDDITVVAYVRHPVSWTRSALLQRLKAGETLDHLYENMPRPNWRRRFTPWLDAVGPERFRLVSFEDALKNEGMMASFCDAAGLPRETVLSLAPAQHANESMSLEAALILDSLNRQRPVSRDGKASPDRRWHGAHAIKLIPGNKFSLSAEQAASARAGSRSDLEWLNATFGTALYPDVFEDAPIETPSLPNTMPQETVDSLAIMLSDLGNQLER